MRSKLSLFLLVICCFFKTINFCYAQDISLKRYTFSNIGSNQTFISQNNNFTLKQSIGQDGITGTNSKSKLSLIQGYIQPELSIYRNTNNNTVLDVDIQSIPNSNKYIFSIHNETDNIYFSLFNTLGQKKDFQILNDNNEFTIDLENYTSGCYIVTFQTNQKYFSTKLIKN